MLKLSRMGLVVFVVCVVNQTGPSIPPGYPHLRKRDG